MTCTDHMHSERARALRDVVSIDRLYQCANGTSGAAARAFVLVLKSACSLQDILSSTNY
jgi:hypothetical protein